ncbi:MAG TPA: carboxypeptidase regulatory-like domain-containing protein [Kofleriaceae bacterium]|nr:carboxypeptidase regulatory-like domain-containing protein [Kofleriaceae bacterium]
MSRLMGVVVIAVCGWSGLAIADGTLSGRVTDLTDQPVKDATVFVAGSEGLETTVTTDANGHYVATVHHAGTFSVVFAFGKARIGGRVDIPDGGSAALDMRLELGGEIIEVHDKPLEPTVAQRKGDRDVLPPYSDRAALGDYWVRAWLLLEVDEHGTVLRVRFLKRPGYDLDEIAVKFAFAMKFEPARDEYGTPRASHVVLPLEWPSYGWLSSHFGNVMRWPRTSFPPCAGNGPKNLDDSDPVYRDCSVPLLSHSDATDPWIQRGALVPPPPKPTPAQQAVIDAKIVAAHRLRIPAYVSIATTAALFIGFGVSHNRYNAATDQMKADVFRGNFGDGYHADIRSAERWNMAAGVLFGAGIVSTVVSAVLWSKSSTDFVLEPSGSGVAMSYGGKF